MPDRARAKSALIIEDARLDYIALRGMLLGGQSAISQLDWLSSWPGADDALALGHRDLYFVDLHLDHVSGLDIIAELRRAGVLAPIIALTGAASDEIDVACSKAGASDFLVKGQFDGAALDRSIRYATRQAAVHRELDRLNAVLERRAEAEAVQARLMRFAIEQSADAMFISTSAATLGGQFLVYANAAFLALLGRREGAVLGGDVASLLAAGQGAQATAMERVLATGRGHAASLLLNGAAGSVAVSLAASPLRAAEAGNHGSGDVSHFAWTCQAATPPALQARCQKLAALGELAGGLAHDFNNLLTAVLGNLELLERKLDEPKLVALVQNATRAADRGTALAHRVLLFQRSGDEFQRSGDDDAVSIVPDRLVAGLHDLIARGLGGLIKVEHAPDKSCWPVRGSEAQLELAVLTLAIEARDAMRTGGTLAIACRNAAAGDAALPPELDPALDYVELSMCERSHAKADCVRPGDRLGAIRAWLHRLGGALHADRTQGGDRRVRLFLPRDTAAAPPRPSCSQRGSETV